MEREDVLTIEQIKAKYRAPEYRPLEFGNKRDIKAVEIAILVLCALGLIAVFGFAGEILYPGVDMVYGPMILLFAVSFVLFLIFFWYFREKMSKEREDYLVFYALQRAEDPDAESFFFWWYLDFPAITRPLSLIGTVGFLIAWGLAILEVNTAMPLCLGSLILLGVPFFALLHTSLDEEVRQTGQLRKRVSDERERASNHEKLWEKAREHEEHDQFDAAMRIWSELGEDGEVERVAGLKTECLCVVLKRKIKDLTEQGVDCTQLEEQLAMIETALEELATSKSSIDTESEE